MTITATQNVLTTRISLNPRLYRKVCLDGNTLKDQLDAIGNNRSEKVAVQGHQIRQFIFLQ